MQCLAMSYIDVEGKYKRGPQIIMRKDAGAIIARTGLQPDWKCLDLGGGSRRTGRLPLMK